VLLAQPRTRRADEPPRRRPRPDDRNPFSSAATVTQGVARIVHSERALRPSGRCHGISFVAWQPAYATCPKTSPPAACGVPLLERLAQVLADAAIGVEDVGAAVDDGQHVGSLRRLGETVDAEGADLEASVAQTATFGELARYIAPMRSGFESPGSIPHVAPTSKRR
jgi:hypothetical protein